MDDEHLEHSPSPSGRARRTPGPERPAGQPDAPGAAVPPGGSAGEAAASTVRWRFEHKTRYAILHESRVNFCYLLAAPIKKKTFLL